MVDSRWSAIAARLPGRTDNEIKNYWNTHIRKRLLRMGIDPVTHSPRLDLLDLSSILTTPASLYNYPCQQINLSRLLGLQQPLLNPQVLRLATSLFSQPPRPNLNPDFGLQNAAVVCNPQTQLENSGFPTTQDIPSGTTSPSPCVPFSSEPNVDQFPPNLANFPIGNCQENNEWQSNGIIPSSLTEDYLPLENYGYYEPATDPQSIMDPPPSDASTYINSCSTTTVDDEIDISYSSNLINFDYSSILEVNDFM